MVHISSSKYSLPIFYLRIFIHFSLLKVHVFFNFLIGMVYTFNMENGFSAAYTHADSRDHYGGDAFVAPRGTSMCTN